MIANTPRGRLLRNNISRVYATSEGKYLDRSTSHFSIPLMLDIGRVCCAPVNAMARLRFVVSNPTLQGHEGVVFSFTSPSSAGTDK